MRLSRPVQTAAASSSAHVPAPVGGKNTSAPGGLLPATDCIICDNLIAGEFGLKTRMGSQEWCTGMVDAIRTVIPFNGTTAAKDRLFAVTRTAIYDCTSSSATPTSKLSLSTTSGNAGFGVFAAMTTLAGGNLYFADEANGLFLYVDYGGSADTWVAATGLTGVTEADVRHVAVWKNRFWFVVADSATAYYLPVGQVTGTVTAFDFGNKFSRGGYLIGLWSLTVDGGTGVDDYLCAISSSGEVLIYQGTDPDSAVDFSLRGSWYAGGLPAGRRIATEFGGDILLLTRTGILPISKLIAGQGSNPDAYTTKKISQDYIAQMGVYASTPGWSVRLHPGDQALIVTVPNTGAAYELQFAQSLDTGGWSTYSGLPMVSAESWNGTFYYGNAAGVLYKSTGSLDEVARDGTTTSASAVEFSLLTAYSSLGSTRRKRVTMVRPHFQTVDLAPDYLVQARYDFDRSAPVGTLTTTRQTAGVWDSGTWDTSVWGSSDPRPVGDWRGTNGIGTNAAVALKGRASSSTVLVGFDVAWMNAGGF